MVPLLYDHIPVFAAALIVSLGLLAVEDVYKRQTDSFVVSVNNYRATIQLLAYADIFAESDELPKLLEIDVRGDVGGLRELLGEYIPTVKGGAIEPHVDLSLIHIWPGCGWLP